jgi:phage baseplate assembly protein V
MIGALLRQLRQLVRPLEIRLANLAARGLVSLANDSTKLQVLQLRMLDTETRDGAERFQEYGFTSVPLADAEAVVLSVGGRRDHLLVVAVDDRRHRKKDLQPGEVALYSDEGASVYLKRGRIVVTDAEIRLGSDGASSFVALAGAVETQLTALKNAISAAPVVPGDGGAAFKASLVAALAAWPGSTAATKVKAE